MNRLDLNQMQVARDLTTTILDKLILNLEYKEDDFIQKMAEDAGLIFKIICQAVYDGTTKVE